MLKIYDRAFSLKITICTIKPCCTHCSSVHKTKDDLTQKLNETDITEIPHFTKISEECSFKLISE